VCRAPARRRNAARARRVLGGDAPVELRGAIEVVETCDRVVDRRGAEHHRECIRLTLLVCAVHLSAS
jgi:hypothetical protein